jgi:general secretion pathway protein K
MSSEKLNTQRFRINRQRYPGWSLSQRGAVLIFVLWVLSFLAVLAVHLAYNVRQKIFFMKRIESRSQTQHITEGCAKAAVALLIDDLQRNQYVYTPVSKAFRHNNPGRFASITVPGGNCEVSYPNEEGKASGELIYGLVDEERKINVNTADKIVLIRIITDVLEADDHLAELLAEAIYDWRQSGDSEIKGFSSDDYYVNLKNPYPKKSLPFELPDELLLVKGIDRAKYEKLRNYLTVYGTGQVNVNTAGKKVLMALGLPEDITDKVLAYRRGADGVDQTADDHIFYRVFDIAAEVNASQKLEPEQMRIIDQLNQRNLLTTNSTFYTIQSQGLLEGTNEKRKVILTFNSTENRIVYWNEK